MTFEKMGELEVIAAIEHPELLATATFDAITTLPNGSEAGVAEIDPALSDTAAFCEKYGVAMETAVNCVILEAKRGDKVWHAACMIQGSKRADVNGVARIFLDARKVSFAPMDVAVSLTGMEYGGITPVGLPADWPILIDASAAALPRLIIGSGIRKSKLIVSGSFLASLPNSTVLEGLGVSRS
jgi:prolyl-tRNA editing enzyme YbaK/EbsC (Cys-tRNA(Pro) deacylase)